MADKKDLQQPATKGDLEELRNEVKDIDERLSGQIKDVDERLSGQIKDVDERLSGQIKDVKKALSDQTDKLTTQIDGLAKLIKNQIEEFQVSKLSYQRQNDQLDDHEKRISQLESATP